MVPYGLNQVQFASMYQRKLELHSEHAIETFRKLISLPVQSDVVTAHLEVFLDEEGGAPSIWVYWHGKNDKVDHKDPGIFPGRSLALELDLGSLATIDERYFIAPDVFPGLQLSASQLSQWLAESWWKAGGWVYPVPTTLAVHDFEASGSVQLSKGGH